MSARSVLLFPDWKRQLTEPAQIPYFLNHKSKKSQWFHPKLTHILQNANRCHSDIRFSSYRTGFKLRSLQKAIGFDNVSVDLVEKATRKSCLKTGKKDEQTVNASGLINILKVIYDGIDVQNVHQYVDTLASLIFELFDPEKCGCLWMPEVKILLIMLCNSDSKNYLVFSEARKIQKAQELTENVVSKIFKIFFKLSTILGEGHTFAQRLIR